jgi:hypothetical protein
LFAVIRLRLLGGWLDHSVKWPEFYLKLAIIAFIATRNPYARQGWTHYFEMVAF